jgi:tripeptide aminopeptidase
MTQGDVAGDWMEPLLAPWRSRRAWILDQQISIAQTPAPTGKERVRAAQLQRVWAADGHEVARDDVGNVFTRIVPTGNQRAADAPSIVCLAHLDTVFESEAPLTVTRDGPRVYCPGIGDNGRGLAAMFVLAQALRTTTVRDRLQRPIDLVLTVGEEAEGNLRGARQWFTDAERRIPQPMAAVAIDGPGDDTIVHHAVGSERLRISITGPGGHSWANSTTPNPIHAAGACITHLAALRDAARPYSMVSVNRMHGGEHLTGVPMAAWLDVDIRSLHADRLRALRRAVEEIAVAAVREESAGTPALTCAVHSLGDRPAGMLDPTHPLMHLAIAATTSVGRTYRPASASTDANIPLSRGIPAIAVGAGGTGGGAHTPDEWYDDTEGAIGMERVLRLILTLGTTRRWTR